MFVRIFMVLAVCGLAYGAAAQERRIIVQGTGVARADPDTASFTLSIREEAPTQLQALELASRATAAAFAKVGSWGVDESDMSTRNITVRALYEDRENGSRDLVGYVGTNSVQVTVRDLDVLGEILPDLIAAAPSSLQSLRFFISDPSELENEVRRLAIQDGIALAQIYADAAGVALGPLMVIDHENIGGTLGARNFEGGGAGGLDPVIISVEDGESPIAVPIYPGQISMGRHVVMVFAIED